MRRRSHVLLFAISVLLLVGADEPVGIHKVHPDERAAVRVLCKKTASGELDEEGHVLCMSFRGAVV